MAPKYIKRVTLFKIPKEDDIDAVLGQYDILRKTAEKVTPLESWKAVTGHVSLTAI